MAAKTHTDPNHPCHGCHEDCVGGWVRPRWSDGEYECLEPGRYAKRVAAEQAAQRAEDAHFDRMAEAAREDALYEQGILPF